MPAVTIELHQGGLDESAKATLIRKVTDAVVEAEGLGPATAASTWVRIVEVPRGNFGAGGVVIGQKEYEQLVQSRD